MKGRVSKSLIHSCLPAKYKQEYRRKNAFKQNKKKIRNKINLAPIVALNRQEHGEVKAAEEEKQKEKVVVMVGADGRSITQIKEDEESTETESKDHDDYNRENKTFTPSSHYQQQLEQGNQIEEHVDHPDTQLKDTSYNGLADNSVENSESTS